MIKDWSNQARVVYKRTYARKDGGKLENWDETVERVIAGNIHGHKVSDQEIARLRYFLASRKAGPAGRGWWFSGAKGHRKLGGVALCNCWFVTADDWMNFILAQDLLMLGGGVGMSIEYKYTSKLPKVKKGVSIKHKATKDAMFIVPDSREGWCELIRRVLEAYFVTGKGFEYSTICIRGQGEAIQGFGGSASGPIPLINLVTKLGEILRVREGQHIRPVDAMDVLCCIGEMVVAGNVRRSALIILGDAFDKEFLRAKRWDLGPVPTQRAMANLSVVCDDIEDLHPLFWMTYQQGEPFGLVNRANIRKYGRMGEVKKDSAIGVNPCAEATLEDGEPCVSYDTPILTKTSGIKQIGKLVGKKVEIWNGKTWSTVTPRLTGTGRKLYRVHLSDGSCLDVTANHGFSVKDRFQGEFTKVQASELMGFSKYPVQFEPFQIERDTGNPYPNAYDMGAAVGDGCLDRDVVNIFLYGKKQALPIQGSRGPAYLKSESDRHTDTVRVRCRHLDPDLFQELKYGDAQALGYLAGWDSASLLSFFAGWIDTDGSATASGGVRLYITNRERATIGQLLLTLVGVKSSLCLMAKSGEVTNKGVRSDDLYYLQITDGRKLPCKRVDTSKGHRARTKGRYQTLVRVEELPGEHDTFCFDEPERHMGVFGNVLTYQCNLQEIALPNLDSPEEFIEAAQLMHRWGKRVTMETYHQPKSDEVVKRNRRIGTGITGCLRSPLFTPEILDRAYEAIQTENRIYSKELGIPESIRTTVVKPSGTMSKLLDMEGYEGIHAAYSRHYIQRIRFAANDSLVPLLRAAGHHIEPVIRFDGTFDHNTMVVDFYEKAPDEAPVADQDWNTWKQLDVLKMAQKHWADQSVSVTVYYRREEIPQLKAWLADNLKYLKTISFLCHSDHGFKQAPKEAISKETFEKLSSKVKPVDVDQAGDGADLESLECAGGSCPIK